jgi:sterol desaturase/sphingolipid hydroxylase (fatty acid hydroxylase superfamily)
MDSIISYFSTIPSLHRAMLILGGLTFFLSLETIGPFLKMDFKRWRHAGTNLFFTFTTIIVNFLLAFLILMTADWMEFHGYGLFEWMHNAPMVFRAICGLLILDLVGAWLAHYTQHHIKWMWQFHLVHHTDQNLDTTSANRHHPGESIIRVFFTILGILISGAPMWLVMIYQSMSVVLTQFNQPTSNCPTG